MPRRTSLGSTGSCHSSVHRTTGHILGDSYTIDYVCNLLKNSDSDNPLEDWSVFYCGGSSKMKADLTKISNKYNIGLSVEKFNW